MNNAKRITIIIMTAIILISIAMPVFAETAGGLEFPVTAPTTGTSNILEVAGKVIGFIKWVSIIAGVIIITILGLKYMMGSLEEKADYKKSFIPLIVGIVVVMSSSTIASLILSTFN